MRLAFTGWWVAWQLVAALGYLATAKKTTLSISRQHQGDMFTTKETPCSSEVCLGRSSGTAALLPQPSPGVCPCQCLQHLPVFRDDMQICVDDIHECPLATFLSGTTHQKIPFVFLPLKGQIVYPSAEISFSGSPSPICVVSGSQYLTSHGWSDLRNRNGTDSEPPFRLYRDEGRTFLQWLGDAELRLNMEGRLLMVHLMCKDMDNSTNIFMPCVAFRVAGSPVSIGTGVKEVSFSADAQSGTSSTAEQGLSGTEYAAIALCSVLLGLIYVSSVLLYLHVRRRKNQGPDPSAGERGGTTTAANGSGHLGAEEGVVKNNPLLRHCHENSGYVTDESCCSGDDDDDDIAALPDDDPPMQPSNQVQVTCAMVHPCSVTMESFGYEGFTMNESIHQDSSAIERLPEENVSIVETPDGREERPETVRAITAATTRRKLYFNPAYFDLELLLAPPPAALEFLTKIREVIAIAKQKMAAKRFLPSLLGIPEECDHMTAHAHGRSSHAPSVASGSVVTVRQMSRRRSCEGCPGCVRTHTSQSMYPSSNCQSCCPVTPENKHHSIRKWLEDVPLVKPPSIPEPPSQPPVVKDVVHKPGMKPHGSSKGRAPDIPKQAQKKKQESVNNKTQTNNVVEAINKINDDLTKELSSNKTLEKELKMKSASDQSKEYSKEENNVVNCTSNTKQSSDSKEVWNDILFKSSLTENNSIDEDGCAKVPSPPPPSVSSSISRPKNKINSIEPKEEPRVPPIAKHLMDAVIKEFADQRSLEYKPNPPVRTDSLPSNKDSTTSMEYDTDSLDRTLTRPTEDRDGFRTPSDYGDMEMKTNVSNGLPLEEELTMRNTVFNVKTGNTTMSKLKSESEFLKKPSDDHEYEVILLNPDKSKLNLPDILSRVEGYSLVSEVYVNDGYSFGSSSSIQSNESSCASLPNETIEPKIKYDTDEPGHLTIEVEDSPRNYERTYDSDCFEPDTLDRKPSKFKINSEGQFEYQLHRDSYADSLERPTQISLKTTGSFRSDSSICWYDSSNFFNMVGSPLNRTFGSLREIFEAKNRYHRNGNTRSETLSPVGSTRSLDTDCYSTMSLRRGKPKILRPEAKQARRQRQPSPHEYVPPRPPKAIYSNEFIVSKNTINDSPPLPPRENKPPLPPKNGHVRSIGQRVVALKNDHRTISSPITQLSSATRGVLASASGHSPTSSEYEAIEMHTKNQGRRFELNVQTDIQKKFDSTQNKRMKNGSTPINSSRDKKNVNFIRKTHRVSKIHHRTEDSGYLSSDSNGSDLCKRDESLSETDDSLCDGVSESGAESIDTDSFFFGKFNKLSASNSVDSGVCNSVGAPSMHSDSDSNVSFVTVLPMEIERTSHILVRP